MTAASTEPRKRELTECEKGYLDGLFAGTRKVGRRMWAGTYRAEAEKYLRSIGLKGWSVNVR